MGFLLRFGSCAYHEGFGRSLVPTVPMFFFSSSCFPLARLLFDSSFHKAPFISLLSHAVIVHLG
eukprot:m.250443 g.250443  ORF g.250443 m.250443 type:complete len:64 (+) comp80102_c0_seq1:89-280(+)